MTEEQQKIFYRLLVDLFLDNPKRKQYQKQEGANRDERVTATARAKRARN